MAVTHLLVVVIAAIGLTIFAERRQVQAPLLLAAVGIAASIIPGFPEITLAPQLILSLVLPPLLYSAALEFSFFSFMKRIGSILNLGVLLVLATTVAGGAVVGLMLPSLSLPLAFVLAAAVAPPDAVSAVAIGRTLGLPSRLMTILKGESLINDAAALTLFSATAAAATGRHTLIGNGALYFLYTAVAGLIIGIVLARLVHAIRRRLLNPSLVTALAFLTPFAAYALAEEAHASGVIAVVFAGFTLGHNAAQMPFAGRIQEREVWRVADTLLEACVFAYMGLQFRFIISDAGQSGYSLTSLAAAAAALFATVVLMRMLWIFGAAELGRLRRRLRSATASSPRRKLAEPLGWRENLVLSWAGMRGVVTLAAAAGTPLFTGEGTPLAGRAALLPIAFVVAMATLLLQGLTLPWLIRRLGVESAEDIERRQLELSHAYAIMTKAGEAAFDELTAKQGSAADLSMARLMLERMQPFIEDGTVPAQPGLVRSHANALVAADAVLTAQRKALIAERNAERLEDEIVRDLLTGIDIEQAALLARAVHSPREAGSVVRASPLP
ncbi:cation:proton antiporter [Sphingomonas sp.]|uniref:cation:proton antiporter n=1 Tax=Sphingomonas sp. TaxID=28214 RepID=UPI003D6DA445